MPGERERERESVCVCPDPPHRAHMSPLALPLTVRQAMRRPADSEALGQPGQDEPALGCARKRGHNLTAAS